MALILSGGSDLTASSSPSEPWFGGVWTVIGVALSGAVLVGAVLGWKLHSWVSHWNLRTRGSAGHPSTIGWHQLVSRALRFIHRRRTVALAFRNYSHHQLPSVQSPPRPNQRRRRVATPGPKASPQGPVSRQVSWSEGPVYHGSNRRGTQ